MTDLKPCPWPDCGGSAHLATIPVFPTRAGDDYWYILCKNPSCCACGPRRKSAALATAAWNGAPRPGDEVAALIGWLIAMNETHQNIGQALTDMTCKLLDEHPELEKKPAGYMLGRMP